MSVRTSSLQTPGSSAPVALETLKVEPLKLDLATADKIASKIEEALAPYCERIAIAGSIRRRCEQVGDIDIVCLPKDADEMPGALDKLHERFFKNIKRVLTPKGGQINVLFMPAMDGYVQFDLSIAQQERGDLLQPDPCNWGSILMLRTGSVSHNIRLVARAEDRRMKWDLRRGLVQLDTGKVIAATEEADIYTALGLGWHEPADRGRVGF